MMQWIVIIINGVLTGTVAWLLKKLTNALDESARKASEEKKQPTGAQDAYKTGDKVWYPDKTGSVYQSLIDGNVWSPVDYPQGWQVI